jgi:hypothetical protein
MVAWQRGLWWTITKFFGVFVIFDSVFFREFGNVGREGLRHTYDFIVGP